MFENIKKLFKCKESSEICSSSKEDELRRMYDTLMDEYESLSRKYFTLKLGKEERFPVMKDEFAPKCVRRVQETCRYFKMDGSYRIPEFKKFLRNSGNWTKEESPVVSRGENAESGEPMVWYVNEKGRKVEIPCGSVMIVFDASPKTEWIVITEERFEKDWMPM